MVIFKKLLAGSCWSRAW